VRRPVIVVPTFTVAGGHPAEAVAAPVVRIPCIRDSGVWRTRGPSTA